MEPLDVTGIDVTFLIESLGEVEGKLIRFYSPRTVEAIVEKLPVEGRAALMRGGIYFPIQLTMGVEKGRKVVEAGDIAYWPFTKAICLFYENSEVYTQVNLIGKLVSDLGFL